MKRGSPEADRAVLARTGLANQQQQWRQYRAYPVSTWPGVDVNGEGRITKLDLHGKNIKCVFPEELCELDALKELVLHTNRLYGVLPDRLGLLSALETLDVWDNFLEGPIPTSIAQLSALTELHLSGNFFVGPIPKQLGRLSNLKVLYLHGNKLTGTIPPQLGKLRSLQKLILINNRLTGPIPVELAQLKMMVELNLANNRLSGSIPAELGQLKHLMKLYLWGNNLTGQIPEELGQLYLLEKLNLAQNQLLMSGGGIPLTLRKHHNFRRFVFAVPEDGAPIPPWRSKRSAIPALTLGYLDLLSDLLTALSYYSERTWWFVLGLVLIAVPALVAGVFVFRKEGPLRRLAVVAQLGLIVESYISCTEEGYSSVLVTLRVLEPLFQSLPQLMLQSYVLLVNREYLPLKIFSAAVSTLSVAFATTGIIAEHPLSQLKWARGVDYPSPRCWRASTVFFGTVPYVGSVILRGGFRMHPQDFVWLFLLYEVVELISRIFSLAVVALVGGYYFFIALAWFWASRWYISRHSIAGAVGQEALRFRALARVVGMPFMDSVVDRVGAYMLSCTLTVMETVCCLVVGNAVSTDAETDRLSDVSRRLFTAVAIVFLGGKIALAIAVVEPFKAKIGHVIPAAKGELRVESDDEGPPPNGQGGTKAGRGGSAAVVREASLQDVDVEISLTTFEEVGVEAVEGRRRQNSAERAYAASAAKNATSGGVVAAVAAAAASGADRRRGSSRMETVHEVGSERPCSVSLETPSARRVQADVETGSTGRDDGRDRHTLGSDSSSRDEKTADAEWEEGSIGRRHAPISQV